MERVLSIVLSIAVAGVLAACARSPGPPSVPKTPEWLCSLSFDLGEPLDVVYLGTGTTRDAALAEARADCARRNEGEARQAICRSGRPVTESCSPP